MQTDIRFIRNAAIPPAALRDLFTQTDWAKQRTLHGIEHMLRQTPLHISAWHADRLIGFARALTDGIYRAVIEDVLVALEYRRRRIGRELIEKLLAELVAVEEIMLGCMEELAPLYERFGFQRVTHPIMKKR